MRTYKVGTRGSKLALWQAEHVIGLLQGAHPGLDFEVVSIQTSGDKRQDVPLQEIGDKSLFLKEIEEALASGAIDLAVHSLKDVPSLLEAPFSLPAILERDDPRDVVLTASGGGLSSLPKGARVGTSSLRREAQLRAIRPDLRLAPIRGNVDTRLRKLSDGEYDAIVLAAAGLNRLGMAIPSHAFLDPSLCLPAPGQAAICVETLADHSELLAPLDHQPTRHAVEAERAFAAGLDAGCRVPVAAYACEADDDAIQLQTLVASPDGIQVIRLSGEGADPLELGHRLALQALERGAAELLRTACP
ncbi:MAG TPA: hydroxymethylbilane synthase [Chloroflexota bacterium]|nr:hydroxymethylbilane synthase [Chloroflexota bacterium]